MLLLISGITLEVLFQYSELLQWSKEVSFDLPETVCLQP